MLKLTNPKCILAVIFSLRFVTAAFTQTGLPTSQPESVLCYKTTTKEVQKLFTEVDYEKMATHELLRTKVITYKQAFQTYLDENDNFVKRYRYEYHHNLFPDWHMAPDETIFDHEGTHQVFRSSSTVYKGGWFGHDYTLQKEGAYTTMDLRHGYPEYTYHVNHDTEGYRDYFELKETMLHHGLLFPFKYVIPTQKELNEYQNQGFTVIQHVDYIKVFNRDITMTWYLETKKVVYEFYENYVLIYKIQRFYDWVEEVRQDVIVKEIETTPYILSTGDCAESETTTLFSDYAYGCDDESQTVDPRVADNKAEAQNLVVQPNPAHDYITLQFQRPVGEDEQIEINIYNSLGSLVYHEIRRGKINSQLNIQNLPSGAYYLSIQVKNDFYTTNLIKN